MISVATDFQKLLDALRSHAESAAKAVAPRWFAPSGGSASPYAPEASERAFPRDALNAAAEQATLRGSVGRAMGVKTQLDYSATAERAYALRHMTHPRAAAHAASRRAGHADPAGAFTGEVLQHVQDLLAAGG